MEEKLGMWDFRTVDNDPTDQYGIFRRRYYCPYCGDWQTYGATKFCPNCGENMFPDQHPRRILDIGFLSEPTGTGFQAEDETEFDLEQAPLADMITELFGLWRDFCDESGIGGAQPLYAREVSDDGFDDDDWVEYEDDRDFYSPSCPWNAPGMSPSDFI